MAEQMNMNPQMDFEMAMRFFFGDKAHHIAELASNPTHRRQWIRKALKKLTKLILALDTTPRHRERLLSDVSELDTVFLHTKEPSWSLVYSLLRFAGRLIGMDFLGSRINTPIYVQSPPQYYTERMKQGGDALQDHYDRKNAMTIRRRLVRQLASEGLDTFTIGVILNITEYEVKRLKRNE